MIKARDRDHGRTNVGNHDYYRAKPYTIRVPDTMRAKEPLVRAVGASPAQWRAER